MADSYEKFIRTTTNIDINKPDPNWAPPGSTINDELKSPESIRSIDRDRDVLDKRHSRILSDSNHSLNVPDSPTPTASNTGHHSEKHHHKKRSIFDNLKRFKSSKEALDLKPTTSVDSNHGNGNGLGTKRSSVSLSSDGYNSEVLSAPMSSVYTKSPTASMHSISTTNMSRASSFNISNAPPIASTSRKSAISGAFYESLLWKDLF